ncbi:right-handed parallel beta-helix repeat-containing protein [Paenibacillus hodogayensis]|uniref:Right-handed parallel beta-helix repeat-containing protein n=1 Tax=Paenibacillus hodogayensis TaxID=279208 RepID=A0ABV5VYW7_9BACL
MKKRSLIISLLLACVVASMPVYADTPPSCDVPVLPGGSASVGDHNDLNAAIDAAQTAGEKLVLPSRKVYEIGGTVTIPTGAEIDFNFSTIRRKAGSGVFDMIRNADPVNGNNRIRLSNLIIDGNKGADQLVATQPTHRFSGLRLEKVDDSYLRGIVVTGTVNAEIGGNGAAGIYVKNSKRIDAYELTGYDNDRTAILLDRSQNIRIFGSLTCGNLGSGISSYDADEAEYHDIVTHHNGYSNLSVNGERSKVSNVLSYESAFSGLNIGHEIAEGRADDTVVTNVHSYNNNYEGLTITGSARVQVVNLVVYGNRRNNIQVYGGSTASKLTNIVSRNSAGGQGIVYKSGTGHSLVAAEVYGNAYSGIYVQKPSSVTDPVSLTVGYGVKIYNNGQLNSTVSGIVLENSRDSQIIGAEIYDDQAVKTQGYGVSVSGGSGHAFALNNIHDNATSQIRLLGSPANLKFSLNVPSTYDSTGW